MSIYGDSRSLNVIKISDLLDPSNFWSYNVSALRISYFFPAFWSYKGSVFVNFTLRWVKFFPTEILEVSRAQG
jgi:hypothetical protein